MVVDGVEQKERKRLRAAWEEKGHGEREHPWLSHDEEKNKPLWEQDREWGNDGLVTVQSAKWGEFLGVMEGCDHWEMRGARGIEFGVDLPALPAIGLGGPNAAASSSSFSSGDGWGIRDWGRFVGAWRKEEKKTLQRETNNNTVREKELADDAAILKSSTAVFDWLVEQVPGLRGRMVEDAKKSKDDGGQQQSKTRAKTRKNELASKLDLERFYVALSRKMYDEGL